MNEYFITKDGLKLFRTDFRTKNPAATVLFVHGYTEHSGRYGWVARQFNDRKIDFLSYDQRGFGRSEGERAFIRDFSQYLEDLKQFINQSEIHSGPVFLVGQSMGSLIGSLYLSENKDVRIKGFVSTSGALKISEHISPLLRKVSGILSAIVPGLPTIKLEANALSRDTEIVNQYLNDPLVYHGGAKARLGHEMLMAMKKVQENAISFTHPVLLLHGTEDRLADAEGSKLFYRNCSSSDKNLIIYEGWYHELFREPGKEEVMQTITDWILERSK